MPESPCFETPTLADRMVVLPSTQVARRIPSKAAVQRRARRARRTRDTVGRLPREQGGLAQGRSQSTACDHHSVTSVSAIAARPSLRRYVVARRRKPTIGPHFPQRRFVCLVAQITIAVIRPIGFRETAFDEAHRYAANLPRPNLCARGNWTHIHGFRRATAPGKVASALDASAPRTISARLASETGNLRLTN